MKVFALWSIEIVVMFPSEKAVDTEDGAITLVRVPSIDVIDVTSRVSSVNPIDVVVLISSINVADMIVGISPNDVVEMRPSSDTVVITPGSDTLPVGTINVVKASGVDVKMTADMVELFGVTGQACCAVTRSLISVTAP